jgi:hypothetical protein
MSLNTTNASEPRVVQGSRDKAGVFDSVFITFCTALSKTMLAISMLTPFAKRKYSCMQERIKIMQQNKKQLKFKNIASRLTQNIFTTTS